MTPTNHTTQHPAPEPPIPREQLSYADASQNVQVRPITRLVDYVRYPTLGCPALLGPDQPLPVLLSLPAQVDPASVQLVLADRHGSAGASFPLRRVGETDALADSADGARRLWRIRVSMDDVPYALFDLQAAFAGIAEVQYNAVRRYEAITGDETVVFCGDSQYNVDNRECLKRFIASVNELEVAWIALIGDVCDNGVKSPWNLVRLAAGAKSGPVKDYYGNEYVQAHELLRGLRHPVVLVPGNHDGMCANATYDEGNPTDVFTGPDPSNAVEYDGLHHFRCTFGPLYFHFDWGGTRYLCTNTFELSRPQRLGYHAIVANWGGWMRDEQLAWVKRSLEAARAAGLRSVLLMHHDPRGGSKGVQLGRYHALRQYRFDSLAPILKAYLSYVLRQGRTTGWQQEWMAPADGDLAAHPVRHLLRALLDNQVWAVLMGHDNENWIDSYFERDDLFKTSPSTVQYATRAGVQDDGLVNDVIDSLEGEDYEVLLELFERKGEATAEAALGAALQDLDAREAPARIAFAADPAQEWGLEVGSAIHFVHLDDVGSYKHSRESDFDRYGFVLARLENGAPREVHSLSVTGRSGAATVLAED